MVKCLFNFSLGFLQVRILELEHPVYMLRTSHVQKKL